MRSSRAGGSFDQYDKLCQQTPAIRAPPSKDGLSKRSWIMDHSAPFTEIRGGVIHWMLGCLDTTVSKPSTD